MTVEAGELKRIDVLANDIEVTGPTELGLFFSTDVTDTDFFATISDVYPDGKAVLITEGAIRARFRESLERPKLLTPRETYEVKIPIWETSNVFKKGHRIRLHLTSSNFPRFDRNLNTGGRNYDESKGVIAHNQVHHSKQHPSTIKLTVVRKGS